MAVPLLVLCCVTSLWSSAGGADAPVTGDQPPRIVEHPSDTAVPRGSPATLNCQAEGQPPPDIRWLRGGQPLQAFSPHRLQLPQGSLFFLTASRADAGVYRCLAVNRAGSVTSRDATLTAAVLRTEFRVSPANKTEASVGARVLLRCSPPRGDPPPTVGWRRDGRPLHLDPENGRRRLSGEGDLVIENATLQDSGQYVCEARNYAGMKRLSDPSQLIIHDLPPPPANVSAVAVSDSAVLVTWLTPGDLRPPQARGFRVEVQSERGNTSRQAVDANSSQVTLDDLIPGGVYSVRVTTLSATGEGPPSAPVTLRLPAPAASRPDQLPLAALSGRIWLAVVVAALVLLSLAVMVVTSSLRRRREKHGADPAAEKRRDGVSLLPPTVRPASWMEGAIWGTETAGRTAELAGRPLTAPPSGDDYCDTSAAAAAAPSPYATTALLQTVQEATWTDSCRKSRAMTSSFKTLSLNGSTRGLNDDASYRRPHQPVCGTHSDLTVQPQAADTVPALSTVSGGSSGEGHPGPGAAAADPQRRPAGHQRRDCRRVAVSQLDGDPRRTGAGSAPAVWRRRHLAPGGAGPTPAEGGLLDTGATCRSGGSDVCWRGTASGPAEASRRASSRY